MRTRLSIAVLAAALVPTVGCGPTVEIVPDKVIMDAPQSQQVILAATSTSDEDTNFFWKSSDRTVVKQVGSGRAARLLAVAPGTATVTAEGASSGVIGKAKIKVVPAGTLGKDRMPDDLLDGPHLLDKSRDDKRARRVSTIGAVALTSAVYRGEEGTVRSLLAKGTDPNVVDRDGRSALDIAIRTGNIGAAKILVSHGARITPFVILAFLGLVVFVSALLPLPFYRVRGVFCRYYQRREEDTCTYLEIGRRDRRLWRQTRIVRGETPVHETMTSGETIEDVSGLVPCGIRGFKRHWKRPTRTDRVFRLHIRLCVIAMLFLSIPFLVRPRMNDPTFDVGILGAFLFGLLQFVVLVVLQFLKTSRTQRRITLIVGGTVSIFVLMGCFLLILAFAALSGG